MKKITHVAIMAKERLTAKEWIQDRFSLDHLQYCTYEYECGLEYLNRLFPSDDKVYSRWFKQYERSASFWKWWRMEYHNEVIESVKAFRNLEAQGFHSNLEDWQNDLEYFIYDEHLGNSFNQYLKIYTKEHQHESC